MPQPQRYHQTKHLATLCLNPVSDTKLLPSWSQSWIDTQDHDRQQRVCTVCSCHMYMLLPQHTLTHNVCMPLHCTTHPPTHHNNTVRQMA